MLARVELLTLITFLLFILVWMLAHMRHDIRRRNSEPAGAAFTVAVVSAATMVLCVIVVVGLRAAQGDAYGAILWLAYAIVVALIARLTWREKNWSKKPIRKHAQP